MGWSEIWFSENLVRKRTERGLCVALPRSCELAGFEFWVSRRLADERGGIVRVRFGDGFTFRLRKRGKGRTNAYEVLEEREVGAAEIADAFSRTTGSLRPRREPWEIHKPEALAPEPAVVPAELEDNQE